MLIVIFRDNDEYFYLKSVLGRAMTAREVHIILKLKGTYDILQQQNSSLQ